MIEYEGKAFGLVKLNWPELEETGPIRLFDVWSK